VDKGYTDRMDSSLFWAKVRKGEGCWEWQAAHYPTGYGAFGIGNHRVEGAHRVAYRLVNGMIPAGAMVLHSCDNKNCVNPSHLFLGTQADNVHDMMAKGRMVSEKNTPNFQLGEKNNAAKLTTNDVLEIKRSTERPCVLARRFGVHYKTIWSIKKGLRWSHVPAS